MHHITGHIDRAVLYAGIEGPSFLAVEGWILHPIYQIEEIEIAIEDGITYKGKPSKRDDVAARFPDARHIRECGFTAIIPCKVQLQQTVELHLRGTLENGTKIKTSFHVSPQQAHFHFGTGRHTTNLAAILGHPEAREILVQQQALAFDAFMHSGERLTFRMPKMPRISVIILVHNQAALTYNCLASLKQNEMVGFEVIVVDNASSDETGALLSKVDGIKIIRNEENLHFVNGTNQGATKARGDYLLFLNNDTVVYPGAIAATLNLFSTEESVGVVGAKLIRPDGRLQEAGSRVLSDGGTKGIGIGDNPYAERYRKVFDADYVSGAYLCTPRALFEALGGFDSQYAPAYYEDTDYCLRAREKGFRTVLSPKSVVLHLQHGSSPDHEHAFALMGKNLPAFLKRHRAALPKTSNHNETTILYVDDYLPEGKKGQGLPRAEHIVRELEKMGYALTLFPTNEPGDAKTEEMINSELQRLISKHSILFVSRPHNMKRISDILTGTDTPRPRIVYDAEAIFALRDIYKTELTSGERFNEEEKLQVIETEVEIARNSDVIISVSDQEAQYYRMLENPPVHVVSHMSKVPSKLPRFDERNGCMTVGPMLMPDTPNADAVLWFLKENYEHIQSNLPERDREIAIFGENRLDTSLFAQFPNTQLRGLVQSLEEEYAKRKVFFAAHRYAAGIPLKLVEAAAHGVPIICSPLLASQLGWSSEELWVAESIEEWHRGLTILTGEKQKWTDQSGAALERIKKEYSEERFQRSLREVFHHKG